MQKRCYILIHSLRGKKKCFSRWMTNHRIPCFISDTGNHSYFCCLATLLYTAENGPALATFYAAKFGCHSSVAPEHLPPMHKWYGLILRPRRLESVLMLLQEYKKNCPTQGMALNSCLSYSNINPAVALRQDLTHGVAECKSSEEL